MIKTMKAHGDLRGICYAVFLTGISLVIICAFASVKTSCPASDVGSGQITYPCATYSVITISMSIGVALMLIGLMIYIYLRFKGY